MYAKIAMANAYMPLRQFFYMDVFSWIFDSTQNICHSKTHALASVTSAATIRPT